MRTRGLRGALAADTELGAGNMLARVLAHGADPDGPGLTFDTAVDGHRDCRCRATGRATRVGWCGPSSVPGP